MFWPILGAVVASGCVVGVVGMAVSEISGGTMVGATMLALLPVMLLVSTFLWLDRWEPEPGWNLLFAFLWGAGVATLGAILINSAVGVTYGPMASAVVSAPLVEEALKGSFLVGMLWWNRQQLDGVVDGVVYAGMIAAGFAYVENIFYLGRAFEIDPSEGWFTFILRGVVSPFAHPLFTVFTGLAVGIAAHRRDALSRLIVPLLGYALAVALHALWNGAAVWDDGEAFFSIYALVMVPLFLGMIVLAAWQRRRERRIVQDYLPRFAAAGWIGWNEVPWLASMSGRFRWRRSVQARAGSRAARAVREYQTVVTELAFLSDRISRGMVGHHAPQWYAQVMHELAVARAEAFGAPGVVVPAAPRRTTLRGAHPGPPSR
ncbi:PrsW family intramembrane metalloprotease [Phytoactinopolyspora halotolerans]|uniref:PrsW family intramembrane metalloprotease n=1 Tax=Phytoactinopolyspora halotolerans TaxID=1981512 RepID=A0A6L9S5N2_9ACTN|nr:PrsW family intramembrane metalloprotease [Phytoactinopolyspora halotolerans]